MLWFYALGAGLINAISHVVFRILKGGHFPGLYTAVGHLILSVLLIVFLVQEWRMFAALYPEEVVDMVLVDSSHPDQWAYAPAEFRASAAQPPMGLAYHPAQRLGAARLTNMFAVPTNCGHPAPYCAEENAYRDSRFMDVYVAEMGGPERDAQVRATPGLDGRPLVVLSASDHSDQGLPPPTVAQFERDWLRLQAELAALSTNSQHRLVEGVRHGTLQTTFAGVTSDAIRRVDAARTHRLVAATEKEWNLP